MNSFSFFWGGGFIHLLMQRERKVTLRDHCPQSINIPLIEHVEESVVCAKPYDEVRFPLAGTNV